MSAPTRGVGQCERAVSCTVSRPRAGGRLSVRPGPGPTPGRRAWRRESRWGGVHAYRHHFSPQRSQSLHQISLSLLQRISHAEIQRISVKGAALREKAQIRKVLRFCTISSGPTALGPKPEPRSLFPRSPTHSLSLFQSSLSCRVLFSYQPPPFARKSVSLSSLCARFTVAGG